MSTHRRNRDAIMVRHQRESWNVLIICTPCTREQDLSAHE